MRVQRASVLEGSATTTAAGEVEALIARATALRSAREEKSRAFGEIVYRFQDLAFAYAYGILGDFHLAEDAAQEAFLAAWRNLDQLRQPAAFPGWLKRIVLSQCNRLTRGKRLPTVALEAAAEVPAGIPDPESAFEEKEAREGLLAEIQALPEAERLATVLFYVGDYSQNDVAAFLDVPVTTVKKRLYSARQKLRERMLDMVRDTLRERRPSRDERFADAVALFNEALESFVARIKRDRYIIAAILFGSLSHDTVWRKSDIDLILVGRDAKEVREVKEFTLVENGVNLHATLYPRGKFMQAIEGVLQGSFLHSAFALSTLLYTTDDSIRALYQDVTRVGERDRQLRLLAEGSNVIPNLAKAEKWLLTRKDLSYSFLWIMFTILHLAKIEVLLSGEVTTREALPRALSLNPGFFGAVYQDLIQQPKDEATIQRALDLIEDYLDRHLDILFGPILDYLSAEGGIRTMTDLDLHFGNQVQGGGSVGIVCEWLADKGIIQKVPSPLRLTSRSQVEVDEAAFYYDPEVASPRLAALVAPERAPEQGGLLE